MRLTREQAIEEHRKMWNWLAEHPDKDKDYYLELNNFGYINNECFLCEYSHQNDGEYCGNDCILNWGEVDGCIGNALNLGLYRIYLEQKDLLYFINKDSEWSKDIVKGLRLLISRTARAIAELPERKENEEN